jgi:flagellar motor switch protein FliM
LLGQLDITLGDIHNMQEDDVLFFKKPDMARMLVNGLPAFDVQVGTLGTQVAVQIERSVVPDKE